MGRTRLRVGEGLVGLCAATGTVLNLPDAQMHPAFVYRPETGEEAFASLLAVPVRRRGHTMGVLVVQNRSPRRYAADEVDVVETVAMLLAEALAGAGADEVAEDGLGATLTRQFEAVSLAAGAGDRAGRRQPPAEGARTVPVARPGRGAEAAGPRFGGDAARPRPSDRAWAADGEESREVLEANAAGGGRRGLGAPCVRGRSAAG